MSAVAILGNVFASAFFALAIVAIYQEDKGR